MRKHMYLIVEHERDEFEGNVKFTDKTLGSVLKGEIGPIHKFDEEDGEFSTVGKQVGLGYHDFDSPEEYEDNDRVQQVVLEKLRQVDESHLERAGVDLDEVAA